MSFKNYIRSMTVIIGNLLLKSFPEIFSDLPDNFIRNKQLRFSFRYFPSNLQEIRDRKTLSFKYLQRKKSRGLRLGNRGDHSFFLKRPDDQRTFFSTLRTNVLLCELWRCLVETTHVLSPHYPISVANESAIFQRYGCRLQLCYTSFFKKVRFNPINARNYTPNSYEKKVE